MPNWFAFSQLAKALDNACSSPDADLRERAAERARQWRETIEGMSSGRIQVGSRTPIEDLPAWVTLSVLHGGFARGAEAAQSVTQSEKDLVARIGTQSAVPVDGQTVPTSDEVASIRSQIFQYYLSEEGLRELYSMLDEGSYSARIPEDLTLLSVAWLLRAGDADGAITVLEAIRPFTSTFKFAPIPARPAAERVPLGYAWRISAGEAKAALENTRPSPSVETMRASLSIWKPLADQFLELWYPRVQDGWVDTSFDDAWVLAADCLLKNFDDASKTSQPPRKRGRHLRQLVAATREAVSSLSLTPRTAGVVRTFVQDMVRKRGPPGSEALIKLRVWQKGIAARATPSALCKVAAFRLSDETESEGILDPSSFSGPLTPAEAESCGFPAGTAMPPAVPKILQRAYAAPISELLSSGSLASAEVFASLLPKEVCRFVSCSYEDPALNTLMAATFDAFARRRSLLLVNYAHQVRISEIPWVSVMDKHRKKNTSTSTEIASSIETHAAWSALVSAAQTTLEHWPGTITPNPLISQLSFLAREAGIKQSRFVEEIAADIFMGEFTPKFARAAVAAATMVQNTVYGQYYGIDAETLCSLRKVEEQESGEVKCDKTFGDICRERSHMPLEDSRWEVSYVVSFGMIIEQSQVLTTHNLAAFVNLGVDCDWAVLAGKAWNTCVTLLHLATKQRYPLATIKNAAYAWRQAIFFISEAQKEDGDTVIREFLRTARIKEAETATEAGAHAVRIDLVLNGLEDVLDGGKVDEDGKTRRGRRFLGWSAGPHWVRQRNEGGQSADPGLPGQLLPLISTV